MANHVDSNLIETLAQKGVSRRDFLKFCTVMAGTLALPAGFGTKIARALETTQRPPVIWLEMQDCVVHYLTFGLPALDDLGRPLFAYGRRIHDNCERRAHFDRNEFVRAWGDEGHRNGWCLYQMGCKGPVAYQNCPTIRWNQGTSWPVGAGHGCIACAGERFWEMAAYETVPIVDQDKTPPATYPPVEGAGQGISPTGAGVIGAAAGLAVGVAGAVAVHQLTKRESE